MGELYLGGALEIVKTFPDESINCMITSPPYWQLRDYGFDDQWGLEPTYQKYLGNLWLLMGEIKRVLRSDGTVWFNLGDTYAKSMSGNRQGKSSKVLDEIKGAHFNGSKINIKEPDKCQLLIPHRFAIGCIDRGWIVRNDIIWAKRNAMPESCQDRFSKKHEYIFFMVKNQRYYFDLDGIRDKHIWADRDKRSLVKGGVRHKSGLSPGGQYACDGTGYNEKGKNPGSVSDFWDIPTQPSSETHYATFNTELIDKPIIAGCPEKGVILDPFCGTGTTLKRALQLNRRFIGIDGKKEYLDTAKDYVCQRRLL